MIEDVALVALLFYSLRCMVKTWVEFAKKNTRLH